MKRLHQLDYLRGSVAIGILLYHFLLWHHGLHDAQNFLGRLGIYGVSVFYALSGLTLFHVYHLRMELNIKFLRGFWKKRIFRILPIYWLVIFLTAWQRHQMPSLEDMFFNLTGLFGVFKWDKYLAVGAWSIGNEIVFYIFFPILMYLGKKSKLLLGLLGLVFIGIYLFFAFIFLHPDVRLSDQWRWYIFPLNQIFLFYGGFVIGYLFHQKELSNVVCLVLIIVGLLAFVCVPSGQDAITLVTGLNRIVFSSVVLLWSLAFYKLQWQLPKVLHQPLVKIGEWSFGMYLLHPLVYRQLQYISYQTAWFSRDVAFVLAIGITILISFVVYRYFETFFINLGKKSLHL